MVASRQVEIPYHRAVGRQRGRGFGALAQVIEELQFPFCVNVSSQQQNAWVLTCWSLLRQRLERLLAVENLSRRLQRVWESKLWKNIWGKGAEGVRQGGSKQRIIIATKSTKQSSRSRRDNFTNISRWSCQTAIFGTNILWQCLAILEGKSQLLTMSCPRKNNKLILLPQLMKTA